MPAPRETTCRICGHRGTSQPVGTYCNGYTLLSCPGCTTVVSAPRPEPQELKRLYDEFFEGDEYAAHRREFEMLQSGRIPRSVRREKLLDRAEKVCRGRDLVEIGGGTGGFGVLARSRGWRYVDYDISESAVRFASALSLEARQFDPEGVPPLAPRSADAAAMWEVLEHVWNLRDYMETVREALRPGGVLLFSTPNYEQAKHRRSFMTDQTASAASSVDITGPPIHVNFFTASSLVKMLRECGFTSLGISTTRFYRPDPTLASVLTFLRITTFLEAPHTLYGIAVKS